MIEKGQIEAKLLSDGLISAGVDEVGRGCLAGPVYAAAVILDYAKLAEVSDKDKSKIRDSKTLSAKQRTEAISLLKEISISWAISFSTAQEIDSLGIVPATFLAMRRSLKQLNSSWQYLLIDGNRPLSNFEKPQRAVIKGDSLCFNIAAASIFAKESRDLFMKNQSISYPEFGFEKHVGYGTKKHINALSDYGFCPLHRKTFAPVRNMLSHRYVKH